MPLTVLAQASQPNSDTAPVILSAFILGIGILFLGGMTLWLARFYFKNFVSPPPAGVASFRVTREPRSTLNLPP